MTEEIEREKNLSPEEKANRLINLYIFLFDKGELNV